MNGSSSSAKPAPEHPDAKARKWHNDVLEASRAVVGLPTLVGLSANLFTHDETVVAITTGVALAIAVTLRFVPEGKALKAIRQQRLHVTTLPWLVSAVLLVVMLVPPHAPKVQALDPKMWKGWLDKLNRAADKCKILPEDKTKELSSKDRAKYQADLSQCVAMNVSPVLQEHPPRNPQIDPTGLLNDLTVGESMLANSRIGYILSLRLSGTPNFVGTGYSEPLGGETYREARADEYLVPNLPDNQQQIWQWNLDRGEMLGNKPIEQSNLLDVLLQFPPTIHPHHPDFKQSWGGWLQKRAEDDSTEYPPVLVRFALIDPSKYSGCLGRPQASRVFMSTLTETRNLTLGEAIRRAGAKSFEDSRDPAEKMYIWVYAVPQESRGQAVAASWGNVLKNFGEWIKADSCKKL
jgi:hypothetical protein